MVIAGILLFAAPAAPAAPPCVAEATGLLQQERYAEALASAERCGEATGHPRSLYLRGVAALALGRRAEAILALQRYLAGDRSGEPPRLGEVATARIQQARREAGVVRLRISPAAAGTRIDVQSADRPVLSVGLDELPTGPDGAELWLDPGRQRITARDGDKSAGREIEVVAGAEAVIVDLSFETAPPPKPPPPPPRPVAAPQPRFPTRAWLALSGIVGAANLLTGIVILPVGALRGGRQLGASPTACEPVLELDRCRDRLAEATTLRGAGAGLLGAGLGVLAGGLTGLAPGARTRKAAWSAELGVGATFGMVGAGLLAVGLRRFNHGNTDPSRTPTPWAEQGEVVGGAMHMYGLGAALLGMGIGLATSATAGLITQRITARQRGVARLRIDGQGFSLRF